MGRSTVSCFKIITCVSDPVDRDDLEASESKAATDKRGWSFRKRSARHRVLSNTVISEAPSSVNKESLESANVDFETQAKSANIDVEAEAKSANVDFETQAKSANVDFKTQAKSANVDFEMQATSAIPEKSFGMEWTDEVPQLLTSITSINSKYSEVVDVEEADTKFDIKLDESVIIVIQAAIRRFLAEKQLMKHKNIVKLQAAVRGHLVRRHAVGSLRCVQAIIKMQALVRARYTRLSDEGSTGKDNHTPKILGKQKSGAKPELAYTSIEKLLSNRFTRQLLESSPRTKSINIKCDPSRSDSAWKWLERWVSASPTDVLSHKPEPITNLQVEEEKVKHNENHSATLIAAEDDSELTDLRSNTEVAAVPYLKSDVEEALVPSQSEENLVTHKVEQPQAANLELSKSTDNSDILANQNSRADSVLQMELDSFSGKPELETEQPKRSIKRVATEQPETEGRKFVFGSRKASNPAFIAAQSKFEELTSTNNSAKPISSSNQENETESYADTVSSAIDNEIRTKEINLAENLVNDTSMVVVAGSECGTELSITSALDSPDQSEVGAVEFEHEVNISVEGTGNSKNVTCLDVETNAEPAIPGTDLSYPITVQSEKPDDVSGGVDELFEDAKGVDSSNLKQKLEDNSSDMQIELEHETLHQAYKSSPEASQKSHTTQGTPSSQVSTKARKIKKDKNGFSQKRKSLSAGKRSPINPSNDSGVRSSLEQIPKDLKTGKRRNSFGLAKSNNVDQEEPRDSSGGHSIPSYMQATESARAKAYANSSPRSSPDVQDKEIYIKKRHSLPSANVRQGSPRIQRSMSQAQQSTKGNGTNPPQERQWQR